MTRHEILSGKVQLYRRTTRVWHCSASINGVQHRASTREDDLALAKVAAEDWYLNLRGMARAGLIQKKEITFDKVADQFEREYVAITEGQRSERWVEGHRMRLRLHLRPFFGNLGISEVTAGKVQDYRVHRAGQSGRKPARAKDGEAQKPTRPPSRSTLHDEIVTLRQVLKTALRHGWLTSLPDLSAPYRTQGKVVHRPWFSPAEYKALYQATRAHAQEAGPRHRWSAEQLHDFVLFMGNTGLRPDEAKNLQHRDVTIVRDAGTGEEILEIEVRGKRGVGYCKSMPGAVFPYKRLLSRPKPVVTGRQVERLRKERRGEVVEAIVEIYPEPQDPLFPGDQVKMFNRVLDAYQLKYDRDGQARTAYSLRHTYICMRLMEGADIYQIAKNCRTSVEMIERFYAAHIKNTLDASAINVRRARHAQNEIIEKVFHGEAGKHDETGGQQNAEWD
ncbi:MAG: tyrosine-type recombinase/integrase [Asticcacaulis sp.]|uniref:tyrosine-type recombinase/integrase n=1 Tax=Asticcacaulis sp. TaxID=1872648 RepID=UPI003F7B5041